MPPCGYSQKAVSGSLVFIKNCYEDLLNEVNSGKHKDYETAINFEINQIEKALMKLHIDGQGNLTQREV